MKERFEVIPNNEWKSFDPNAPGGGECSTSHNIFPITKGCTNPQTMLVESIGDLGIIGDTVSEDEVLGYARLCDDCYKNHTDKKGNHVYDIAFWVTSPCDESLLHHSTLKDVKITHLISLEIKLQEEWA